MTRGTPIIDVIYDLWNYGFHTYRLGEFGVLARGVAINRDIPVL